MVAKRVTRSRARKAPRETPADRLWLDTLLRDAKLGRLSADAARAQLVDGGFPTKIIDAYLEARSPRRAAATG